MKKLLSLVLLLTVIIVGSSTTKVDATGIDDAEIISWSLDEYSSGYWRLQGYTNWAGLDVSDFVLSMPAGHLYELRDHTDTITSRIAIYSEAGPIELLLNFEDLADRFIMSEHYGIYTFDSITNWYEANYDYYDIDLFALGVDESEPLGDVYFWIYLDTSFASLGSTLQAEFLTYIQDYYDYQLYYDNVDFRQHYFLNTGASYGTGTGKVYSVPYEAGLVNINYHGIDVGYRDIFGDGTSESYIRFYNGVTLVDTYYLHDYLEPFSFDISIPFADDYTLGDYTHYRITLYSDDYSYLGQMLINQGLEVTFVSYAYDVEYYSEGVLIDTDSYDYDDLVIRPTDPTRAGYEFLGWYTEATSYAERPRLFTFDSATDPTLIDANTLKLYAEWREIIVNDTINPVDPTAETGNILSVLTEFGMGDTVGRIMFFVGIIAIVVIASMVKGVTLFPTSLLCIGVTTIFVVLGFIPVIVSALAFIGLGATAFLGYRMEAV